MRSACDQFSGIKARRLSRECASQECAAVDFRLNLKWRALFEFFVSSFAAAVAAAAAIMLVYAGEPYWDAEQQPEERPCTLANIGGSISWPR